jgi:hypothetical protein
MVSQWGIFGIFSVGTLAKDTVAGQVGMGRSGNITRPQLNFKSKTQQHQSTHPSSKNINSSKLSCF